MGVAGGDYNNDGLLDIARRTSPTTFPRSTATWARDSSRTPPIAAGLNVQNRYVEWGAALTDFDNDGFADLLYVTGHVYPEIERLLAAVSASRSARALSEPVRRAIRRRDRAQRSRDLRAHSSRGAAFGDVDNDGDVDVLVMNMNEPPSLLRNDSRGGHAWIEIALEGRASNRSAIGATVVVSAGGRRQARAVLSQIELLLARRAAASLRARRVLDGGRDRDPLAVGARAALNAMSTRVAS